MDDIKWLEVTVEASAGRVDELAARLTMNGVSGMVIEDEEEFRQFLQANQAYWDYVDDGLLDQMRGVCRVKFYVTDDAPGRAQLARWTQGIDAPFTAAPLADTDWAHSWQKYYRPLEIGARLYVVPEWERESTPVPAGRTALYLNPGLTFGTGSHASTQLCLQGVEQYVNAGGAVLDLGCGSGILSIAALRLGAASAAAVDIDPKARDIAYENASLNGIGRDRYTVLSGDILSDPGLIAQLPQRHYHLVLANIVADVILSLSPMVHRFLTQDGVFLCSGIISPRAAEVEAALIKNGFSPLQRWEQNGWAAFAVRQAGPSEPEK